MGEIPGDLEPKESGVELLLHNVAAEIQHQIFVISMMLRTGNFEFTFAKAKFQFLGLYLLHHVLYDLVQELLVCLDVSTEVHSQAAIVSVDVDCERAGFLMLKTL